MAELIFRLMLWINSKFTYFPIFVGSCGPMTILMENEDIIIYNAQSVVFLQVRPLLSMQLDKGTLLLPNFYLTVVLILLPPVN